MPASAGSSTELAALEQPQIFYGEGAGVLYEPDISNYGKPAAIGAYLGFSIPGTKIEGAVGPYIENPSIAGAYSCPGG